VTKDLRWFSTVRGRLGVSFDRLLIYGTGGLAVGRLKSSTSVSFGTDQFFLPGFTFVGSDTLTRIGWAAGVGAEWAITDNWSVKAEYLHLDFGSFSYLSPCTNAVCTAFQPLGGPQFAWQTDIRARENIVRFGASYRFGYYPVVAKY
jgi:outer membrane immunogenic protein